MLETNIELLLIPQ